MFIEALHTIAKIQKQPNCSSNEQKKLHTHTHTHTGILLSHKKDGILPLATTWMELESTMQSEIRQTKTNALCHHLYVESKKIKESIQQKRNRLTDLENKLLVT